MVINTDVKTKKKHWPKFRKLIERQFEHGGVKYTLPNVDDKEATDLVCEMNPGNTGYDWILGTIVKYCTRHINFQREKDLLKIATFAYICWLKGGYHLLHENEHDEDIRRDGK